MGELNTINSHDKTILLVSVLFVFLTVLMTENLFTGITFGLVFFFLIKLFKKLQPIIKEKKKIALIEKELPFALLNLSIQLNLSIPIQKAFKSIAESDFGVLSKEFQKICREIFYYGVSVEEALIHFSKRINSSDVKRSIVQIIGIERLGRKELAGEPLKRIALELLEKQKAKARAFNGKLIVYSLMFTAFSALIPALFQAFILIGSFFLEISFTPFQILLIIVMVFPLTNSLILYLIKNRIPEFLKG
jgi:pilus assembly protein TadC